VNAERKVNCREHVWFKLIANRLVVGRLNMRRGASLERPEAICGEHAEKPGLQQTGGSRPKGAPGKESHERRPTLSQSKSFANDLMSNLPVCFLYDRKFFVSDWQLCRSSKHILYVT